MPKPQIVCVLGMHRSGTSLITRVLNLLGVYLGPDAHLMTPNENNPSGYWEHQLITDLNDEILSRLGGSWDEAPAFSQSWANAPELADIRSRAQTLIHWRDAVEQYLWTTGEISGASQA